MFTHSLINITNKALLVIIACFVVFGASFGKDWSEKHLSNNGNIFNRRKIPKLNVITEKTRPFLSVLEKTIENCKAKCSMCQAYRFCRRISTSDEFNCDDFAMAAYFHTTTAHGLCNFYNPSLQQDSIKFKHRTTINIKKLVNGLSTMENAMCYVTINRSYEVDKIPLHQFHALALEIRPNGFYIYNSFRNAFSNAWFSGITNESLISNWDSNLQISFFDYQTQCGLGIRLNEFELINCLEMWESIFNVMHRTNGVKINSKFKMEFNFLCKNLTHKFKNMDKVNKFQKFKELYGVNNNWSYFE